MRNLTFALTCSPVSRTSSAAVVFAAWRIQFYDIMPFPGLDLTNRTAVVIGGTSGIGRAIALGLADAGANVVPTGRREKLAKEVAQGVIARGRDSLAVTTDVSDTASIQKLADVTVDKFGKVDILVNTAGRTVRRPTLDVSDADWHDILDTNTPEILRTCPIFGTHTIDPSCRRITNTGSL